MAEHSIALTSGEVDQLIRDYIHKKYPMLLDKGEQLEVTFPNVSRGHPNTIVAHVVIKPAPPPKDPRD